MKPVHELPLRRASLRLRLGLPAPSHKPAQPADGLSWYQRNRQHVLDHHRADYAKDSTKQRAAVRASQAKQLARLIALVQFAARPLAA